MEVVINAETAKEAAQQFAASKIRQGFLFEAPHVYRHEKGAPLYGRIRLKHPQTGEKWIRPLRRNGHGYELSEPEFDNGKPLYNLPEIVGYPDAVIWLTEGEWAADHLNKAFRKLGVHDRHIATTSGGAESASAANWNPLHGRQVRVWRDNDDAGLRYAEQTTKYLQKAGCRVQWVDIEPLQLPARGDAVNWLAAQAEVTPEKLDALPLIEPPTGPDRDADTAAVGPPRMRREAFHGLLKEVVDAGTRNSEASPVAIAANVIAWFSATIGRRPYQWVGDARIHCRPYFIVVGNSAKRRKGTAEQLARRVFAKVEELLEAGNEEHEPLRIHTGGLSSGKGISYAIRDVSDTADKEGNPTDPGVRDKRLLVIENEFANALANTRRETNTLSAVIRNCWDGRDLGPLTKNNRTHATEPHVVVVGHITARELLDRIEDLEIRNGLLNRFLLCHVQREKLVPFPLPTPEAEIDALAKKMAAAVRFATRDGSRTNDVLEVKMDEAACCLWKDVYPTLARDIGGVTGELTARVEVYVRMLAMIFALLDRTSIIGVQHLQAALYWRDYVTGSVEYIFDDREEQQEHDQLELLAEEVLKVIRQRGQATKTDISNAFQRHKTSTEINAALKHLLSATPPRIQETKARTAGRPKIVYELCVSPGERSEVSEEGRGAPV